MAQITLKANINECTVEGWQSNTGEVNARVMSVEMSEDLLTCDKQFVTFELADGTVYESLVVDGKAKIPIFEKPQFIKIGVYAENISGDECEKRYSAHPANQYVTVGSFKDKADEQPKPTPGDYAELLKAIEDIKNTGGGGSGDSGFEILGEVNPTEEHTNEQVYGAKALDETFVAIEEIINEVSKPIKTERIENDAITIDKVSFDFFQSGIKADEGGDVLIIPMQERGEKAATLLAVLKNKVTELNENSTDEQYASAKATYNEIQEQTTNKQDKLVSGQNIKTINGQSILGEGNLVIEGGSSSGEEWVEILDTTLTEDVAYVDLVAEDGKMFKKLHILVATGSAGLSTGSKILIKGTKTKNFEGSNSENLTITSGIVNTWGYPIFIIEKGALFPITLTSMGTTNGTNSTPVSIGGTGQNHSLHTDARFKNNGAWKLIRIAPYTADVVFKAGVTIYAWGVLE